MWYGTALLKRELCSNWFSKAQLKKNLTCPGSPLNTVKFCSTLCTTCTSYLESFCWRFHLHCITTISLRSHNKYHLHSVTRETHSQVTCTYACFLMFVITDMGSLNRTEVPRNLRCPTAVRKSANGKASLAPVPNTLQNTKMIFIWYFFIGSQISISISLFQF